MKKAILTTKSEYDRGTYTIKGICGCDIGEWQDLTIWDFQKSSIVKDMKEDNIQVYEEEYYTPVGTFEKKIRHKKL